MKSLLQYQIIGLQKKNLNQMRKEGMTSKEIAKYLGVGTTTIEKRVHEYKLKRKKL